MTTHDDDGPLVMTAELRTLLLQYIGEDDVPPVGAVLTAGGIWCMLEDARLTHARVGCASGTTPHTAKEPVMQQWPDPNAPANPAQSPDTEPTTPGAPHTPEPPVQTPRPDDAPVQPDEGE